MLIALAIRSIAELTLDRLIANPPNRCTALLSLDLSSLPLYLLEPDALYLVQPVNDSISFYIWDTFCRK